MPESTSRMYKFIGCEIIHREACYLAATGPHKVDVEFLRKGLHDLETHDMVSKVQATIDAIDPSTGHQAVLLGYARCNDGLVGVQARDVPLVIPKAHDCITFFFGSRAGYQEYFNEHPGTYYLTTGWSERNTNDGGRALPAYGQQGVMAKLGLTEPYEDMVAKYGKENADFIVESMGGWEKHYTDLLYIEMGSEMGSMDESDLIERGRQRAADNGWAFETRKGDWSLLKKLFHAQWDDDFVVIEPGQRIAARDDGEVLAAE